jgi:transcription initiation factor TFIIH subunit 3
MQDAKENLLVVVVDTCWKRWVSQEHTNFEEFAKSLAVFCNAYAMLDRSNKLAVLSTNEKDVVPLFPVTAGSRGGDLGSAGAQLTPDSFIPSVESLHEIIKNGLMASHMDSKLYATGENGDPSSVNAFMHGTTLERLPALSRATSQALCIVNRQNRLFPRLQSRIMVAQVSKDAPLSYNATMNSIFSAQKLNVAIDSLVLAKEPSSYLQQASFLTDGVYQHCSPAAAGIRITNFGGTAGVGGGPATEMQIQFQQYVLTVMLTYFLPSHSTRQVLRAPTQKSVTFRATCFCHRKPVEFAYMCAVCLALTCESTDTCVTCGSTSVRATQAVSSSADAGMKRKHE